MKGGKTTQTVDRMHPQSSHRKHRGGAKMVFKCATEDGICPTWTGTPARKAPVLKGSTSFPFVVVPCTLETSALSLKPLNNAKVSKKPTD